MPDLAPPRRRFQFRLRTLLIVATLLAVVCGYAGRQIEIVRERRSLLTLLVVEGGGYWNTETENTYSIGSCLPPQEGKSVGVGRETALIR